MNCYLNLHPSHPRLSLSLILIQLCHHHLPLLSLPRHPLRPLLLSPPRRPHAPLPSSSLPLPLPSSSPSSPPSPSTTPNTHAIVTRGKVGIQVAKRFDDFQSYVANTQSPLSDVVEPSTYTQASRLGVWNDVMAVEYNALLHNSTWSLVPRPPGVNIVSCKWVFWIKCHLDGTTDRHKARLVAKGYSQEAGIDYT